jgi:tetratricopeptide (TPR) repeat protein
MGNIFLVIFIILISLGIFSIILLAVFAVISRSRSYPQVNQSHITQFQNSAQAYLEQGNAKFKLGRKNEAITDYNCAITINFEFAEAYSNRGAAKSALGDKQGAINDFDHTIILNPKSADAYYNRGNAKCFLGDREGAIIDTSKAAKLFRQQGQIDLYKKAIGFMKKLQNN